MRHNLNFKSSLISRGAIEINFQCFAPASGPSIFIDDVWRDISQFATSQLAIVVTITRTRIETPTQAECLSQTQLRELSEAKAGSRNFSRFIGVLRSLKHQSDTDQETSVRDLFYKDVRLFGNQIFLNRWLHTASQVLNCLLQSRFKIAPSAKGLVWSSYLVKLRMKESAIDLSSSAEPRLIPTIELNLMLDIYPKPNIVAVFEKDAILKQFSSQAWGSAVKILAITGKGFPDRGSKAFLRAITKAVPNVHVLIFVDSDVYGLQIYRQYANELLHTSARVKLAGAFILEYSSGWLALRDREWRLMIALLKRLNLERATSSCSMSSNFIHREITRGLLLYKKSEINIMKSEFDADVSAYLWRKINSALRAGDKT